MEDGEAFHKDKEKQGEVCVEAPVLWRSLSESLCIQSVIDLNSPLTSYHSSTYKPTALIAISIIGYFHCESVSLTVLAASDLRQVDFSADSG